MNRGICNDLFRGFRCTCAVDFDGPYCERDKRDMCVSAPCQHDATCTRSTTTGFTCTCEPAFSGALCERRVIGCGTEPCANNGTCAPTPSGFACTCPAGFIGSTCQLNVDGCLSMPCANNGTCTTMAAGTYACQCEPEYTGPTCEVLRVACGSSPCENGGRCDGHSNGTFVCHCGHRYAGPQCELTAVPCAQSPCLQPATSCYSVGRDFRCVCAHGYRGPTCGENNPSPDDLGVVNECLSDPCQHQGTCGDLVGHYFCACLRGTTGVNCETNVGLPCRENVCANGGTCLQRQALVGLGVSVTGVM